MKFARNMKILRSKNNITQEQMAEKCGVSRSTITKWETGLTIPDLYMVLDISKILKVSLDELINGKIEDPGMFFEEERMTEMSKKMDRILELLGEKSNNTDAYLEYEALLADMCELNEGIPADACVYWASEEVDKGNYPDALRYYEQAIVRGDIQSIFSVLSIYQDIFGFCNERDDYAGLIDNQVVLAKKMQQYGKIMEDVLSHKRIEDYD